MRAYWEKRANLEYYRVVKEIAEKNQGNSILDVGGWNTPVVLYGDFKKRSVINLFEVPEKERWEGIDYYFGDFMDWNSEIYDLVTCLQTIEHLDDYVVKPFVEKLFSLGKSVIISVPYMWEKTAEESHLQDPIDYNKLLSWTKYHPSKSIMTEGSRLVCYYRNTT